MTASVRKGMVLRREEEFWYRKKGDGMETGRNSSIPFIQ
jgi:hypothetical protein